MYVELITQTAQWYNAMSGDPPAALDAVDYGWEVDETNKCLNPRNMADGIPYAPEHILKLVRCGCVSERACRGGNCGCMGRQLVCTMFCACGSGRACSNPFNTKEAETDDDHALDDAAYQDIDTDTDENGSIED